MAESISWSVRLSSASGIAVGDTGTLEVEAVTMAPAELEAEMADPIELDLQLAAVDKIDVLLISSSVYDGNVEVQGDKTLPLTGPLLLFGGAIELFAASLDKLKLQNKSKERAEIQIFIGRELTG